MSIQPVKTIRKMQPYVPPLDGRRGYRGLLLDFNEKTTLDDNNLYPEYDTLRRAIAKYCKVDNTQVLLTAGAGSAISLVFRAYCELGDKVVIPAPSFELLFQSARISGAKIYSPSYDEITGKFPPEQVLESQKPKIIVVCNPNNPTGTLLQIAEIKSIATKYKDSLILVDEAYFEYSNITTVGLIETCPNIVAVRTFSKAFGMAALRVGYVIAKKEVIDNLQKVSNPYDIAMPSVLAVVKTLEQTKQTKIYAKEVMLISKKIIEEFFIEYAIPFYPSGSNFICFKTSDVADTFEKLASRNILVRKVAKGKMLRVTIGSVETASIFVRVFKEILDERSGGKIAFIDRDGTLIFEPQDTYQVDEMDKLCILPGVEAGLKNLLADGYRLIMVTNQDGLGTAGYPRKKFLIIQNALLMRLAQTDIYFERAYICPHFESDKCPCRKPKTKLVDSFIKANTINKEKSFVMGDRKTDQDFAANLGLPVTVMKTNSVFPKLNLSQKRKA